MGILAAADRLTSGCTANTADVVGVVRGVVGDINNRSFCLGANERAVDHVCGRLVKELNEWPESTDLLVLSRVELTDPVMRTVTPYSDTPFLFKAWRRMFDRVIPADASHLDVTGKTRWTNLAALVVDGRRGSSGQINHPKVLIEEIEQIAVASATISNKDASNFLRVLEEACRRAHRAGCPVAGVLVRDAVNGRGHEVDFEPLFARDRNTLDVESVRRGNPGTLIAISVRQQEVPGGGNP